MLGIDQHGSRSFASPLLVTATRTVRIGADGNLRINCGTVTDHDTPGICLMPPCWPVVAVSSVRPNAKIYEVAHSFRPVFSYTL